MSRQGPKLNSPDFFYVNPHIKSVSASKKLFACSFRHLFLLYRHFYSSSLRPFFYSRMNKVFFCSFSADLSTFYVPLYLSFHLIRNWLSILGRLTCSSFLSISDYIVIRSRRWQFVSDTRIHNLFLS